MSMAVYNKGQALQLNALKSQFLSQNLIKICQNSSNETHPTVNSEKTLSNKTDKPKGKQVGLTLRAEIILGNP